MGIAGKFKIKGGIEQVEAEGFGKNLLQPGAFARPPRTKQEKRSIGALEQTGMTGKGPSRIFSQLQGGWGDFSILAEGSSLLLTHLTG